MNVDIYHPCCMNGQNDLLSFHLLLALLFYCKLVAPPLSYHPFINILNIDTNFVKFNQYLL